MRKIIVFPLAAAVLTAGGCSGQPASSKNVQPRHTATTSAASNVTAKLVWTFIDPASVVPVNYVARMSDPGSTPVSGVTVQAFALDVSGTIVGSAVETVPTVPAHGHFDYAGVLGDAFSELSGKPASVRVTVTGHGTPSAPATFLATGTPDLSRAGNADSTPGDPYDYNLSVKVTNNLGQPLTDRVHQQGILYGRSGAVVGGFSGSSDNQPGTLQVGASYQESVTGIPATHPAASIAYSVWRG